MKRQQQIALSIALLSSTTLFSTNVFAVEATLTGNAGILSDYIYRGIPQNDASGNGGVDLEIGGFYLGTWLADVGAGNEWDIYGGYVHEFENGLYLGAGYTSYQYPDNFDFEYNEVNVLAGWSDDTWSLDLEYSPGEYNGTFADDNGNIQGDNYDFYAATLGWNGVYVTYGKFDDDADEALGSYWEFGYGFEVAGFDMTAAIVHSDADILQGNGTSSGCCNTDANDEDETQAYVSIHRSFDIMSWGN